MVINILTRLRANDFPRVYGRKIAKAIVMSRIKTINDT